MTKNKNLQPARAKIIGLWGDPGVTEYYNFDFLSRFLLVQLSPYNQVPCRKDAKSIIKLVLRPRSLWIEKVGDQRVDYFGNRNTQLRNAANPAAGGDNAANYSISNIGLISKAYKVGDEISLTRLERPVSLHATPVQTSATLGSPAQIQAHVDYSKLAANRIFDGKDVFESLDVPFVGVSLMSKAYKNSSGDPNVAIQTIHSYIEGIVASQLQIVINRDANNVGAGYLQAGYLACFDKLLRSSGKYKNFFLDTRITANKVTTPTLIINKGRLFKRYLFPSIEYIDSNLDNRRRSDDSGCLPLIVASPSTFPTPISRNLGGVNITL